ncbi:MAG: energy-coupling factor transporter ATPase [Clostridia bacterium]|nr:energy-coupling factor transporter ATPase [Clostridia bacterium]
MYPIELKNVSFVYGAGEPYEIRALDNINLKLGGSMMTGFMGHTGSGKSTLVQLLNGILKPTSGQVLLDGKDIWENPKKIRDVRFKVGVVMQYPEYQLFDETVRADIAFGPKNMGLSKEEIEERVMEAVRFSGLDESLLDKSPFELSGGQKRRAALAGVMAMRPEILVLDEPAAGLDPGGRREILGRIREYQRSSGTSVIIVSHSMEDMALYCDRIIVMSAGRVAMDGTCAEVFGRYNELFSVGLDVPQITYVADALRRHGIDIGADIYTVKYAATQILEKVGKEGIQ